MFNAVQEMPGTVLNGIPDPSQLRHEIGKRTVELGLLRRLLKLAEERALLASRLPDRATTTSTTDAR
jgi:hypothetical protein